MAMTTIRKNFISLQLMVTDTFKAWAGTVLTQAYGHMLPEPICGPLMNPKARIHRTQSPR